MTQTDDDSRLPEAGDEPSPLELTPAEEVFCRLVRSGDPDDTAAFEELCAERPELEAELRQIRFNWTRVSRVVEHLQGGPTFGEELRARLGADLDPGISLDDHGESGAALSRASTELLGNLSAGRPAVRRYEVKDEVARGGMGAIYRIWDRDLRRTLAMKVMLHGSAHDVGVDQRVLGRFLEEAQITGQLDHPGIVPVHDLGIDARGRVYFTMRYVRGVDLKQVLKDAAEGREGWSQVRVLGVLQRVAEALAFAHSKGVVHRDLKPANVMVGRFGETYVMDWGLAKVIGRDDRHSRPRRQADVSLSIVRTDRGDERHESPDSPLVTLDGDVIGTPSYMAPEQALGKLEELGPRSDVYSLGCILYQLLTGHVPYVPEGSRVSPHTVLGRLLEGPPAPISKVAPDVPSELAAICDKAMEREPQDRYGDMMELAEDVRAFLEGRVVRAYETGAVAEFRKWVVRNKALAGATAAAVVVAIAALTWVVVVQTRANRDLELAMGELQGANIELASLTEEAELAAERERESAAEALEQAQLAARNEELARRRAYVSKLVAVDFSLRLNRFREAKELLEECEEAYRGWEYDNLLLRADTSLLTIDFYPRRLKHARFTRDDDRILAGMAESFFDLRDAEDGTPLARLEPRLRPFSGVGPSNVTLSALSGDGRRAVAWGDTRDSTGFGGIVRTDLVPGRVFQVWDLDSLEDPRLRYLATPDGGESEGGESAADLVGIPLDDVDPGPEGGIPELGDYDLQAIALDRDGSRLAVVANAVDRLYVLDTEGWEVLLSIPDVTTRHNDTSLALAGQREPRGLAFSPDGTTIAVARPDDRIELYSATSGERLLALDGHDDRVQELAFHPSEPLLASASSDRTIRLWDTEAGDLRATLVGHSAPVLCVAFDDSGRERLISGSDDSTARVWDYAERVELATLRGHQEPVEAVAFDAEGARVLTASRDRTVKVWDPTLTRPFTDMRPLESASRFETKGTTAAAFGPNGRTLVSGTSGGDVWRWDATSGSPLARLDGAERWIAALAVDPTGALVAAVGGDPQAYVWDAESGTLLRRLEGHEGKLTDVVFLPSTGHLATASGDETVRVWDPRTGAHLLTYEEHRHDVEFLAAQPGGELLASLAGRRGVHVWDPRTGELHRELDLERGSVESLAFHPDGGSIALGYRDARLQVWDVETGELLMEREADLHSVDHLAYSPDGSRLAAGSNRGRVQVWDAVWGEPLLDFQAHEHALTSLEFDGEGARLLTTAAGLGSDDKDPPRVWETSSPRERRGVIRAAGELRARVAPIVDGWFDELYFVDEVRRRIGMAPDLTSEERRAALRLATLRGDDPGFLVREARELLRGPRDERDPRTARRLAEAAFLLERDRPEHALALGVALYETGDYAAATERFDEAASGFVSGFGRPDDPDALLARTYRDLAADLARLGGEPPPAELLETYCQEILQANAAFLAPDHYRLAEDLARWSLERDPDPERRVLLGIVLYRRGAYEEALEVLGRAREELEAAGSTAVRDLASSFQVLCYYRLGRVERREEIADLLRGGVESALPAAVKDFGGLLGGSRSQALQALVSGAGSTLGEINEYLSDSISLPFLSKDEDARDKDAGKKDADEPEAKGGE